MSIVSPRVTDLSDTVNYKYTHKSLTAIIGRVTK